MRMVTGLWWLSETCWTESLETQAARRLTGRLRKRGGRSPPEFTEKADVPTPPFFDLPLFHEVTTTSRSL